MLNAVGGGDRARLGERRFHARAPLEVLAQLADRPPRERRRGREHREPSDLAPEHALLVVLELDVDAPRRGASLRPARARRPTGRSTPS